MWRVGAYLWGTGEEETVPLPELLQTFWKVPLNLRKARSSSSAAFARIWVTPEVTSDVDRLRTSATMSTDVIYKLTEAEHGIRGGEVGFGGAKIVILPMELIPLGIESAEGQRVCRHYLT